MNRLSVDERAAILSALAEGRGVQATCGLIRTSKNTVLKLVTDVGQACVAYADRHLRALPVRRLHCEATPTPGGAWTFSAIDADTRLVLCWRVGSGAHSGAEAFVAEAASRANEPVTATVGLAGLRNDTGKGFSGALEAVSQTPADKAKLLKHLHAVSLHFMVHNFVTALPSTGRSPAMAAGLAPALWTMQHIVRLAEGHEPERPAVVV
ncbi:MAG: hypothetical protein ACK44A_00370 [Roseateles sp.]